MQHNEAFGLRDPNATIARRVPHDRDHIALIAAPLISAILRW